MPNRPKKPRTETETIREIRRRVAQLEYVCSGTLLRRTKTCGRKTCRCAQDPDARHGPYYEWSRLEQGRLVHTTLSAEEGQQMAEAIRSYRLLRRLIRLWERASFSAIRRRSESSSPHDNR
jgi:hypothetical protein